jgi:leader peptidase (prepilin peptidase) / N-methyltransferase
MAVDEPKRSFCPLCKYQIPWTSNLPLITWLVQRGKCKNCRAPIPFRYFGVELFTGLVFLAVWWKIAHSSGVPYPGYWVLIFPMFTFASLLIVATFIDFEHFIIPDSVTIGGTMAGLVFSAGLPWLHGETTFGVSENIRSLGRSALGAGVGFGVLWGVVELGKLAFGRKRLVLDGTKDFSWLLREVETPAGKEHDADLVIGDIAWLSEPGAKSPGGCRRMLEAFRLVSPQPVPGEKFVWSETFARESDRFVMQCESAAVDGEEFGPCELRFSHLTLSIESKTWKLEEVMEIRGMVKTVVFPQEAMGFGDVKFMACIGAFLGWQGALFSIIAGACFGAVAGVIISQVAARTGKSIQIPFGPYLALGASVWFFYGPQILAWYWTNFVAVPVEV